MSAGHQLQAVGLAQCLPEPGEVGGAGAAIGLRFVYFWATGHGAGHVQSLILASILVGAGFQTLLIAIIADLLSTNRKLLEDVRFMVKQMQTDRASPQRLDNDAAHALEVVR